MAGIFTTEDNVRLRSAPDFSPDNIIRKLQIGTTFEGATRRGEWWSVDGGYLHASVIAEVPDVEAPSGHIPYRSQWDTDANNRVQDCGQTCVAMIAQWWGIYTTVNSLVAQSSNSGLSDDTDLVANFRSIGLLARPNRLDPGEMPPLPSICLVWYGGFNRNRVQDRAYKNWHWLVLLEKQEQAVIVHDPNFWGNRRNDGAYKSYSLREWNAAYIPYSGDKTLSVTVVGPLR